MPDAKTIRACLECVAQDALEVLKESGLKRVTITADANCAAPYWSLEAVDAEGRVMVDQSIAEEAAHE